MVDEDTYWRKNPASAIINEGTSQDYGFPEGEESLYDQEDKPRETTLLRCFPEVGVFSLRDKEWGKSGEPKLRVHGLISCFSIGQSGRSQTGQIPRKGF